MVNNDLGSLFEISLLKEERKVPREIFGDWYIRKSSPADCQQLIDMHGSVHGFPGMLSSIDCMHWEWKNCPTTWKLMYTTGFKGKHPTVILEVVADYRLWICQAYFGVAGSNNDINVLQSSPLFNDQCNDVGPAIVTHSTETCTFHGRKDAERTFGVLQSRWAWTNEDAMGAGPSHGVATVNVHMGVPHGEVDWIRAFANMRQTQAHIQLQNDIVEELWMRRGRR
ncbi:uncharacterized protein LOC125189287 [Salvia hispanica]|uniref:uncharacterized protein LOC125189287 n=1 Tax=Salvia hispanica TaxID=49212 RepID=UPI002008F6D4|nr:uncharacterized protein LOC125189287 [Salvia hispanica]